MIIAPRAICGAVILLQLACSEASPTAPSATAALVTSSSATASKTDGPVERPYGGTCDTIVTTTPVDPLTLRQRIQYTCRLQHLGRTTAINEQIVNLTAPGATTGTLSNRTVYTAANGDQLFADFSGVVEFNFAANAVTFSGTETFSGGTGRFTDASGEAFLSGSGNLQPGVARFSVSGLLAY
jgi:hypothetical protein